MASAGGDESQRQGGRGKKRKRQSKYLQHGGKKSTISAGVQGFLITCVTGKERQSIKEAINLLDRFADVSPGEDGPANQDERSRSSASPAGEGQENGSPNRSPSNSIDHSAGPPDAEGSDDDSAEEEASGGSDGEPFGWTLTRQGESSAPKKARLEATCENPSEEASVVPDAVTKCEAGEASKSFDELLAAELDNLRDRQKARFVGYETGCNGIIFVRMHSTKGVKQMGPKELAEAIVRDAAASKQSRSRFCMRLLPVELTCYASTSELQKVAEPLILRHFPKDPDQPSIKYAVICESRANTSLNKMDFIHAVAKMVPEPHCVDLKKPDKTILVQIVKTACAIGVVEDFKELAKYNLRQLTSPPESQTKAE